MSMNVLSTHNTCIAFLAPLSHKENSIITTTTSIMWYPQGALWNLPCYYMCGVEGKRRTM